MKVRLVVAALFLGTLAAALWLFGAFSTPPPAPEDVAIPAAPTQEPPRLRPADPEEPKDRPDPDVVRPAAPIRVLVVGEENRSYTAWLLQLFSFVPEVKFRAWYAVAPPAGAVMHAQDVPGLDGPPTPADLEDANVLVVAPFDPSHLPPTFWSRAAERVREGRLGLLLLPDARFGKAMADVEALHAVSPVTRVKALAADPPGSAVPGLYAEPRPLLLTEEGARHPAMRIVGFEKWNRRWWEEMGVKAPTPLWASKFCAPVDLAAPGAVVLARMATGIDPQPAILVPGDGVHVIWAGGIFDIQNPQAYADTHSVVAMRALVHRWLYWLTSPRA